MVLLGPVDRMSVSRRTVSRLCNPSKERLTIDTYTPDLNKEPVEFDETDYTPPFRPLDSEVGQPHEHAEGEDGSLHILPIDTEDFPSSSNPHDPLSDAAKDAHDAEGDFTEVTESTENTHTGPTSFETDSNPSSTTFCSVSHNPDKPLVQYALTIDAGSTGSRIHVYKFHNCHAMPSLEYETFKMNPGLSAFARDPTAAAASLDSLLDEAKRVVPEDMWHCSPVEVKATAGLRLLGAKESEAILDEVRNRLETNYPFVVGSERSVEIMDGKDEGEL
jgi:guanosine-diphosphatase